MSGLLAPAAALAAAEDAWRAGAGFRVAPGPGGTTQVGPAAPGMLECATSGTSGQARVIRRSQASWVASFEVNRGLWGLGARDIYATFGAPFHSLALYGALEALHLGAAHRLLAGLRPDRQAAALPGATVLYITPAQIRQLAGSPAVASVRRVLIGGAALDAATAALAQQLFPQAALHVFYGASETSFMTLADAATPAGSVGRPYPGLSLSLRDAGGQEVAAGETGEIWVAGPYLFDGYAEGPAGDTRRAGAFLTVGEFGRLDAAGNLWLAGRRSRMFTVADRNLFPEEIETWALTRPGVTEAAVLPRPDPARGAVPVLVLCPGEGFEGTEALLAAARAAFAPGMAPRAVVLRADWPRLASGKTDLQQLALP